MLENVSSKCRLFTAKVGNIKLRFARFDEPHAETWLALLDILAAGRLPRTVRLRLQKRALQKTEAEHRVVELEGRETSMVPVDSARELIMRAAEYDYCPSYLADVFEVVASYARDELQAYDPSCHSDLVDTFGAGGDE